MLTRKKAGQITMVGPGENYEADTSTCKHCNKAWVTRSTRKGEGKKGGTCRKCFGNICPQCQWKECETFLNKLDRYEAKQRMLEVVNGGG